MSASIKSVFLSDFTGHQETKIALAPPGGLTMLAGKTAAGKSQIVRALRLLYYNSPPGSEYIRTGRDKATVAIEMSDGVKVARERSSGSVNRYRITKPGEQPQILEGFGLSVPVEVQELTGVRTVSIGESLDLALNLSEQLDGPFLGNKVVSGPARAKILGSLAGTEEVDRAHQDVGVDLHRAGLEVTRLGNEITDLEVKIAEYDYLPGLAERIEALSGILTEIKALQSKLTALESCARQLLNIGGQRVHQFAILSRWKSLREAVSHVEYAEGALTKMKALAGYRSSLASIAAQRAEWQRRFARWAGLEEAAAICAEAEKASLRLAKLDDLADDLANTRNGMEMCRFAVEKWTNLDAAETTSSACSEAMTRLQSLTSLHARLVGISVGQTGANWALSRWANLASAQAVTSTVQTLQDRLSALCSLRQAAENIRQSRVVAEQALSRHTKALADAQSLYTDTLIQLGVCPLCGSTVDPESIKSHIKEVA